MDSFEFIPGQTWLSTTMAVVVTVPGYLLVLSALRRYVAARGKPFELKKVVIVHNATLSILSAVLWIALASELKVLISNNGFFNVYCDVQAEFTKGRVYLYYYINYIFKFVELLDTVLLVLRGKPTPFLHVYHHAATLVLCWSQLRAQSCVQWIPIVINLWIHIIMYMYYALHAMGRKIWWKKYLTMLQILQFVVGLVGCVGGFLPRTLHDLGLTSMPKCHGTYDGALFGIGVLATYLHLFVKMFRESHGPRRQQKKAL